MDVIIEEEEEVEERKKIYFKINDHEEPYCISGLTSRQFLLIQVFHRKAYKFILNALKKNNICIKEEIKFLYKSMDGIKYEKINYSLGEDSDDEMSSEENFNEIMLISSSSSATVYLDETSNQSSTVNNGKKKSSVWKYFLETDDPEMVECKFCQKKYKTSKNTSNQRQHLIKKHYLMCGDDIKSSEKGTRKRKNSNSSISSLDSDIAPPKNKLRTVDSMMKDQISMLSGEKADRITNAILFMIAKDLQPYSMVEDEGFKNLMRTISPLYKVPSRKTIAFLMDMKYEKLNADFKKMISNVKNITITCDNWTDSSMQSYIGVTAHYGEEAVMKSQVIGLFELDQRHDAEYLSKTMLCILKTYGIHQENIVAFVSDRGANIKKALEDTFGHQRYLPCFAHILAGLAPATLDGIERKNKVDDDDRLAKNLEPLNRLSLRKIINKIRKIITVIKRSIPASDKLKEIQKQADKDKEPLKFILDVSTRWNSTYYMIERFLLLQNHVYTVASECHNPPDMLTREEIKIMEDFQSILSVIESITQVVSADRYPTAGLIIPLSVWLKNRVKKCQPITSLVQQFQSEFLAILNLKFEKIETKSLLAKCTFLDPRFKKKYFESPLVVSYVVKELNNTINLGLENAKKTISVPKRHTTSCSVNFWDDHDNDISSEISIDVPSTGIHPELQVYMTQDVLKSDQISPANYWRSMSSTYPNLSKIALQYAYALGTSVSSERLFSKAGWIHNNKRNRLKGKHMQVLTFLSYRSSEEWNL